MAVSKAYLGLLVEYLDIAAGKSPMAIIGKQRIRCSLQDVELCLHHSSPIARWVMSKISTGKKSLARREELLGLFDITSSLDFDLHGDPDICLDLSQPVREEYRNSFQSLLEIGTLEHIVNPYQALVNFDEMVAVGGIVIHLSPIKIRPNHGYYTISPQLLFDFYLSNARYELVRSHLISYYFGYDSLISPTIVTFYDIREDLANYRDLGFKRALKRNLRRVSVFLSAGTYLGFVVQKIKHEGRPGILLQEQYRS